MDKSIDLIGYASGWGAGNQDTEQGPQAMLDYGLLQRLQSQHINAQWRQPFAHVDALKKNPNKVDMVRYANHELYQQVYQSMNDNLFPVVIGGDHSSAIATWSATIQAIQAQQNFGLIWLDAHMDAHTFETTPSNNIHGMPLACLLGHGSPELINMGSVGPKLNPKHVVLLGVRSFEQGEMELLESLNVKIFYMEEIQDRGFEAVFQEAYHIVNDGTKGFGITIDLDVFDPNEAPGVGSIVTDGLHIDELLPSLVKVSGDAKLAGIEFAEYNPILDKENQTAELVATLAETLLSKRGKIKYEQVA